MHGPTLSPADRPAHLEISRRDTDGGMRLTLRGELDLAAAPALARALSETEQLRVVLDLSQVSFIDSAGVRVILDAKERAEEAGCEFVLASVSTAVARLLSLAHTIDAGGVASRTRPGAAQQDAVEQLIRRCQREHDEHAREELLRRFMPLARRLALRYGNSSVPRDDLVQVASLGLVKAIERFDADRGRSFAAYAVPTILGELRRYFRDCGWGVHVPRGAQERSLKVRDAVGELTQMTGRDPTANQLAEYLEVDIEEVIDGLQAIRAYEPGSLDVPLGEDEADMTKGESLGTEDAGYEFVEKVCDLAAASRSISERDREILRMRYAEELSQYEIGARIGCSQMQVSRILRRVHDALSEEIG